jgi:GrpB-like predicted nucleotidyltransferase (UPF0157 family)
MTLEELWQLFPIILTELDPSAAKEYEQLKLGLWKPYEHDRDGYTAAKAAFVARCTWAAKRKYGLRYAEAAAQE